MMHEAMHTNQNSGGRFIKTYSSSKSHNAVISIHGSEPARSIHRLGLGETKYFAMPAISFFSTMSLKLVWSGGIGITPVMRFISRTPSVTKNGSVLMEWKYRYCGKSPRRVSLISFSNLGLFDKEPAVSGEPAKGAVYTLCASSRETPYRYA